MPTVLADLTDEDLAARVGEGNEPAFAELYERYFERVFDFSARIVRDRDAAADVAQGAFTRAWERMSAGERPQRFKAWIYTVARNRAIDHLRRGRRQVSLDTGDDEDDAPALAYTLVDSDRLSSPGAALLDADLAELVWSAAASLTPQDYALLDMQVRQSLTTEEMAEALEVRTGSLYTRLSRLRDNLEESLTVELLRRRGRKDCAELDAIIAALPDEHIDRATQRTILRHLKRCEVCDANRRRFVTAAELFAALVAVPAPAELRAQILERSREARGQNPGGAEAGGGLAALNASPLAWVAGGVVALLAVILAAMVFMRGDVEVTDPTDASSTSHTIGIASTDRVVRLRWTPPAGATGFSIAWSPAAVELPDTTVDLPGDARGVDSPSLTDGQWHFHLRTRGAGEQWTSTLHLGPFVIGTAAGGTTANIEVIEYQGRLIPTSGLHRANPDACPAVHWHAPAGIVALDGTRITDPAPNACGLGRVDERPTRSVPAPTSTPPR